jgi:hypothetical protein
MMTMVLLARVGGRKSTVGRDVSSRRMGTDTRAHAPVQRPETLRLDLSLECLLTEVRERYERVCEEDGPLEEDVELGWTTKLWGRRIHAGED